MFGQTVEVGGNRSENRSLFKVVCIITHYTSDDICAVCSWAPSSVSKLFGNFPQMFWSSSKSSWRLHLYLWSSGYPENHPAWPHPPQGKEGTGTFFKAPSFGGIWSCLGGSRRWNRGQIPGDRYWQHCTAIPEKLKQLRERWLSSLSFWAIFHFLKEMEASKVSLECNSCLE